MSQIIDNRTNLDQTVRIFDSFYAILELLDQIKGKKKMEMNQILAYYLNSFKSKTSLYGIAIIPKSNQPVARNIVQ